MCSGGTFFASWLAVCISSSSTCKGVLPNSLASCVSVSILVGIRFSNSTCKGRISCVMARVSVMTKMFSSVSVLVAGKSFGILIGIVYDSNHGTALQ